MKNNHFDTEFCLVIIYILYSVCNFQAMKSPMELNSLLSNSFVISPGLLYHLIRRDSAQLANEAFTSSPIVSSKHWLIGLKITNCISKFLQDCMFV